MQSIKPSRVKLSDIREQARSQGLEIVGALALEAECGDSRSAIAEAKFHSWQAAGFPADMKYLLRAPSTYFSPRLLLPSARAILSFFIPYRFDVQLTKPVELGPGSGRVASYAWGLDYHLVVPPRLTALINSLLPPRCQGSYRVFTDAVPLHERHFAAMSGIGFLGKNSLLITYQFGSFGFLAEVLVDFEVALDISTSVHSRLMVIDGATPGAGCGNCDQCLVNCPTGAIVSEGVIDARRCISYLTIEKRGPFNDWESAAIGEWIFGCDLCQDVCPFNSPSRDHAVNNPAADLVESNTDLRLRQLELSEVLSIRRTADFKARFATRPLLRSKREGLLRNAAAVAKNRRVFACLPELIECVKEDSSPVVREEALRTLRDFSNVATGLDLLRINQVLEDIR